MTRRTLHLGAIILWALLFSALPPLVSRLPLNELLSSDAQFYVALEAMIAHPGLLAADQSFAYASSAKPGLENVLHWSIAKVAETTGHSIAAVSIAASIAALLLFVVALYELVAITLRDRTLAFVIAFLCVIPVHALAATTFGFQALGFLPRDFALAVALLVVLVYFQAMRDERWMPWVFLGCGLLGTFYILVAAHLFATLWLAEVLRARAVTGRHLLYGVLFGVGASPAIIAALTEIGGSTPVDVAIMRMRHPYMLITPFVPALETTLRRVLIYAVVTGPLAWGAWVYGSDDARARIAPWTRLAMTSLVVTVAGVIIEQVTTLWPYMFSRTSVFFILSAMVVCCASIRVLCRQFVPNGAGAASVALMAGLLLMQSNLPSIYRFLADARATAGERRDLIEAARWLQANTGLDQVALAPTSVPRDSSITVRAYAFRPIYVSEKDGGVSMLDGDRGRAWMKRMQQQQQALDARNVGALIQFMRDAGVTYAILERQDLPTPIESIRPFVVHEEGAFVIMRAGEGAADGRSAHAIITDR